jgi:hypothetical protein
MRRCPTVDDRHNVGDDLARLFLRVSTNSSELAPRSTGLSLKPKIAFVGVVHRTERFQFGSGSGPSSGAPNSQSP